MGYVIHVILGFVLAYLSFVPPGMLNMTAVRNTLEKGFKEGFWFAFGAAIVVIPQAFVALAFAQFFDNHPEVVDNLKWAGIVVLLTLSMIFFYQARKKFTGQVSRKKGKSFAMGVLMSAMNMMAIPFYLVLSSVLKERGRLIMEQPFIILFVIGLFLGALSIFLTYVRFASIIQKRAQFIASNINYILSLLFFILGIFTLYNMVG